LSFCSVDPTPIFQRKRYYIIFLAFLGFVNMYTTRVSFSTVIDPLVRENGWTNHQRGFALGAFFYGYIATQIVGGIIAGIVGGHWVSASLQSYRSI
jgi:sugar phosphate permease